MTRIAILGANGQVGAELCLLLAAQPGIEIVPVCRRRFGSAYLRSLGLACRHGQAADPAQASALFGDCDVIVNLALVGTTSNPVAARRVNLAILGNIASCSKAGAKHLYFSTMSVHGDRRQGERFALRNSYGQEKLRSERLARSLARQAHLETYVFRLGHVCGELQGITRQIRRALQSGPVALPDPDRPSNTVHVATIADAILEAAAGAVAPGTYDLMNVPQWSWREVFEFEARALGLDARIVTGASQRTRRTPLIARLAKLAATHATVRRAASRLVVYLPPAMYRRSRALYSIRTAAAEIAQLRQAPQPLEATLRAPVGSKFVPSLSPTASLLGANRLPAAADRAWPEDLPLFRPALREPPLCDSARGVQSARASSPT